MEKRPAGERPSSEKNLRGNEPSGEKTGIRKHLAGKLWGGNFGGEKTGASQHLIVGAT